MKIIKEYLDSLFLSVPRTPETARAKEDLLAIMEDHYHELIAEGKSEHEAIGAVISEFGSIDELLAELEIEQEQPTYESMREEMDAIDLDEMFDFWAMIKHFSLSLSLGVMCCILAVAAFATVEFFDIMSVFLAFVFIAVGVGFIISSSMKYVSWKKRLDDRPFRQEVVLEAMEQVKHYEKSFRVSLVLGIGVLIVSLAVAGMISMVLSSTSLAVFMMFVLWSLGVFLIIYSSVIRQHFVKITREKYFISNEDKPGPRSAQAAYGQAAPIALAFKKFYWPLVLVIYFLGSYWTNTWGFSWLLFVFAGIFQDFIFELLSVEKKQR